MSKKLPTTARLHELFRIDEHGNLVGKFGPMHSTTSAGDIAGSINAYGHLKVKVDCQFIYNHRVIWAMTFGEWPSLPLDHINGIKTDNRPENLRLATHLQNAHNRGLYSNNTTGFRGVTFNKGAKKYLARIAVSSKQHVLGYFETAEEASKAYEAKAKELHGEFYRDMGEAA